MKGLPSLAYYEKDDIQTAMALALLQLPDEVADGCLAMETVRGPEFPIKTGNGESIPNYLQIRLDISTPKEVLEKCKTSPFYIGTFTSLCGKFVEVQCRFPEELNVEDDDTSSDEKE